MCYYHQINLINPQANFIRIFRKDLSDSREAGWLLQECHADRTAERVDDVNITRMFFSVDIMAALKAATLHTKFISR